MEQEVVDAAVDYAALNYEQLVQLLELVTQLHEYMTYVAGFLLFFVIVVLCYFSYKFLRIFI